MQILGVDTSSHLRKLSLDSKILPHGANNLYQSVQVCPWTQRSHYPSKYLLSVYCGPITLLYNGVTTVDRKEKKKNPCLNEAYIQQDRKLTFKPTIMNGDNNTCSEEKEAEQGLENDCGEPFSQDDSPRKWHLSRGLEVEEEPAM